MTCFECQAELTPDDIGFHKKMISRGAEEFLCIPCLCKRFDMTRERALELIAQFRKSGCTLFA